MKKGMILFLLLWICFGIQAWNVSADAIFEPENVFYKFHARECKYVNSTFTVNGYEGKTELYKSPLSDKVLAVMKNNEEHYISFTYTDKKGNEWGLVEDGEIAEGWVPMVYMYAHYGGDSFLEEYKSQIKKEEGIVDVSTSETIYRWAYPGSGDPFIVRMEGSPLSYDNVFTDEQGLKWAYVDYYYHGPHTYWVCIDDPSNLSLPIREVDDEMPDPPKTIDRVNGDFSVYAWLAAGGIAVTVIVTGCLIWGIYGNRRKA